MEPVLYVDQQIADGKAGKEGKAIMKGEFQRLRQRRDKKAAQGAEAAFLITLRKFDVVKGSKPRDPNKCSAEADEKGSSLIDTAHIDALLPSCPASSCQRVHGALFRKDLQPYVEPCSAKDHDQLTAFVA
jgi:hypothetical protein